MVFQNSINTSQMFDFPKLLSWKKNIRASAISVNEWCIVHHHAFPQGYLIIFNRKMFTTPSHCTVQFSMDQILTSMAKEPGPWWFESCFLILMSSATVIVYNVIKSKSE